MWRDCLCECVSACVFVCVCVVADEAKTSVFVCGSVCERNGLRQGEMAERVETGVDAGHEGCERGEEKEIDG